MGGGRAKISRIACLTAGMVGCGGGPGTLFPSRGREAAGLNERVGDHRHQSVSVQARQDRPSKWSSPSSSLSC